MPGPVLHCHGDDVHFPRNPVLDDLVLLGRIEAGRAIPDQLDAELLRGFLGAGAAAHEVGIALRLRHHRDHAPRTCRPCWRPGSRGGRTRRRRGRRHDRAHEPYVGAGDDQRRGDDRGADDSDLTVFHFEVSVGCTESPGVRTRRARCASRIYVNRDRGEEQSAGEYSGKLRRQRRKPQAVAQDREREQPEQRSPQRALAAKDGRPAEHHRRNRVQLISIPGIGARLSEVRDINDCGQAGVQSRQEVHQPDSPRDWNSGVSRAGLPESDRVERAADDRSMQQDGIRGEDQRKDRKLCRDEAPEVSLAKEEKS